MVKPFGVTGFEPPASPSGLEVPPLLSRFLWNEVYEFRCGECRWNYIASKARGRGFESRRLHHDGAVAQR
jgi:hypothetical protein